MTCSIFFTTEQPDDRPQITGPLPRKPQRWLMEWLVKTPDGRVHINNSRTLQRATVAEVNTVMGITIDEIKAELGEYASFISWRLTSHGGTRKNRKGGKR